MTVEEMKKEIHEFVLEKLNEGIVCATTTIKGENSERVLLKMIYLPSMLMYRTFYGEEVLTWLRLDDACEYYLSKS